jgi:hypothetical protein
VDLAPDAPFRAAVLAGVPLAFAFHLDPGAIHQQVQRTARAATRDVDLQGLLPARQRAEVRNGPVQADQAQQAFDEAASPRSLGPVAFPWLDLTERHSEQHLYRQTGPDGSVAVVRMPPVLASRRGLPTHRRAEPDCEGAVALDRFVIGAPVPGPVGRGCRSSHAAQLARGIHKMNPSRDLCNGAR